MAGDNATAWCQEDWCRGCARDTDETACSITGIGMVPGAELGTWPMGGIQAVAEGESGLVVPSGH